jgi:xanthine dehydrogenase accessory factor
MVNIYDELVKLLAAGKKTVLARIIRQVGSAPRTTGTKFLVLEDDSLIGTIGGGSLEYQVIKKAGETFKLGKSSILNFRLTGGEVAETEMLCGGIVDVFLEPVFPENPAAMEVFQSASETIRAGRRGTLVSLVSEALNYDDRKCRMLIADDGSTTGDLGGISLGGKLHVQKWSMLKRPSLIKLESNQDAPVVFVEPLEPDAVLYLFGAGHVSTMVAPLAKMVGFRVSIIDDREDFANRKRFANADEIIVCSFKEAFQQIAINSASYIAIITRGHIHDRDVLKEALATGAAYIGMIGSLRKRDIIYQALMEEGLAKEKLEQVHSPIGLDIGAETPEEIALSIVAEMVRARAQKSMQ